MHLIRYNHTRRIYYFHAGLDAAGRVLERDSPVYLAEQVNSPKQ